MKYLLLPLIALTMACGAPGSGGAGDSAPIPPGSPSPITAPCTERVFSLSFDVFKPDTPFALRITTDKEDLHISNGHAPYKVGRYEYFARGCRLNFVAITINYIDVGQVHTVRFAEGGVVTDSALLTTVNNYKQFQADP